MEDVEYAEVVIAGAISKGTWSWYISHKDFWYLDLIKRYARMAQPGRAVITDFTYRFGMKVVSEENAEQFLAHMEQYRVTTEQLSELLLQYVPAKSYGNVMEVFPSFLVDFDCRVFRSLYPETYYYPFHEFIPSGWTGKYEDFFPLVPLAEQYWIVEGMDHLAGLLNQ